jgi:sarcosine oxidase subunit beta
VLERLAAAVRVQNAAGVSSRLVSPVEAGKLVPSLETTSLAGGSYCAEHGYIVSSGQRSRRSPGSSTSARATVEAVVPAWALETTGARFAARSVVIATGVDTRGLLAPLGADLPIELDPGISSSAGRSTSASARPLVMSPERRFAAKQLHGGRVLASDLGARPCGAGTCARRCASCSRFSNTSGSTCT